MTARTRLLRWTIFRAIGPKKSPQRRIKHTHAARTRFLQLALRAGFGVGGCQIGLAKRDPNLVRVLPDEFSFPMKTWIVMHEDLRAEARMRATFDHLAQHMTAYAGTSV